MKQKFGKILEKRLAAFIFALAVILLDLSFYAKVPASSFPERSGTIIVSGSVVGSYAIPIIMQGIDHATGQNVNSVPMTINFTVTNPLPPPPSCPSFTANPTQLVVPPPASSTLSWNCGNAVSCSIDNGVGSVPVSGSATVSPSVTTNYTLTCDNSVGQSTSKIATVTVFTLGVKEQ